MGMDDAYKMINQTLVSLINEIWELEEKGDYYGRVQGSYK